MNAGYIVLIILACLLVIFVTVLLILMPRRAFFVALFSRAYIPLFKSISMKLRKEKLDEIVDAYILAKRSKLVVSLADLEVVSTSGGHPLKVVEGVNASKNAKLNFDFEFAKAVDISGRDVLEVVRECINPKIIELPLISSVAQDNFEVNVKVSLTLKVNIKNFLTGVTEDTISARAVEAVVTKIANTPKASDLVAKPQLIDKAIFDAEIDMGAKYELVSADVIHADLGTNRGLSLEKEKIEKSRLLDANQLEHRRLVAVAVEQEMKAKAEEMKLKVIEQEAEVPKAVVQAIKEGKMKDVVDYYKLQNLQADTDMRRKLAGKKDSSND